MPRTASGADRARPVLNRLLAGLQPGTTVCVIKLDRLARPTKDLLDIVDTIERAGAHLRVLGDPIDTATPVGRFFLTLLGAFAEFELSTICERTRSGLRAAKARGRVGSNPALRDRDPDAIRRMAEARRDNHRAELVEAAMRAGGTVGANSWGGHQPDCIISGRQAASLPDPLSTAGMPLAAWRMTPDSSA